MTKCKNHSWIDAVYDSLCQDCLNARKNAAAPPPSAQKWTPTALKATFGKVMQKLDKTSDGYYLVQGSVGMHLHVYSGMGVHVKVGQHKHMFINKKGEFMRENWVSGIADVQLRATGELEKQLLAAMALTLASDCRDLTQGEIETLIAALPIPVPEETK